MPVLIRISAVIPKKIKKSIKKTKPREMKRKNHA